jgi:tetratricopeptide (TPR) repeat protein
LFGVIQFLDGLLNLKASNQIQLASPETLMKFRFAFLALLLCVFFCSSSLAVMPKDNWTSVRSKNFFLIGNAGEKDIKDVATRLEQFRDVFTRLLPGMKFNSPVPTTVVVFKNDSSYKPFKPNPNFAGYFQPGPDVNYITLTTEKYSEQPYRVLFHEYVHQLTKNTLGDLPAWFSEGLAEYYSTFDVDKDRIAKLGLPISNHIWFLREQKLLPLRTLFAVDHNSPYYNERDKQSMFYAQSWALVHYLIFSDNGQRVKQLNKFLDLIHSGLPSEKAFPQAFGTDFATVEKELSSYVHQTSFPYRKETFQRKLEFDSEMTTAALSEAEAQAYLGDLLVHLNNQTDAEKRLQQALALDPNSSIANASMGILRSMQGRFSEAKTSLQRAVADNSKNHLAHYYYAFALSREWMDDAGMVSRFPPQAAATMREELKKTIALSPTFPESYGLLALVNLVTGERIDESIELVKRGLTFAAGHHQLRFMLAQLYLRKENFKDARLLLEPLIVNAPDQEIRTQAKSLLDQVTKFESLKDRSESRGADKGKVALDGPLLQGTMPESNDDGGAVDLHVGPPTLQNQISPLRKPEAGEAQVRGQLVRIECINNGVIMVVSDGQKSYRFFKRQLESIKFVSFVSGIGSEITCGPQKSANSVVVTYRPGINKGSKSDGEPMVVEFVPKELK